VVQALTAWVATGAAEASEEMSGPRIQPEGSTTAPGVLASTGGRTPTGIPHAVPPVEGAPQAPLATVGVVQLLAAGAGLGLPHADAGAPVVAAAGLGLPHADEGAGADGGVTTGVGTTATGAGVRGRDAVVDGRRLLVVRAGVPVMGIIGTTTGSAIGSTAAG
jgi:hypothetical protein